MSVKRDRRAFLDACTGVEPDDRVVWRLGYLDALLADLVQQDWTDRQEDPPAAIECLRECRALARRLREACEAAVGPVCQQPAEDDRSIPF